MPKNSEQEKKKRNKCFRDCAIVHRGAEDAPAASERLREQRCQHAGKLAWLKPECYDSPSAFIRKALHYIEKEVALIQPYLRTNWERVKSAAKNSNIKIMSKSDINKFFTNLRAGKFKKHLPSIDTILMVIFTVGAMFVVYSGGSAISSDLDMWEAFNNKKSLLEQAQHSERADDHVDSMLRALVPTMVALLALLRK